MTITKTLSAIVLIGFAVDAQAQVRAQDGRTYQTVKIGNQEWMAENLNVSAFRNGATIPEVKTNAEWERFGVEGKPAWCFYENNTANGAKYGKLYNWYAVNDPRGLAPQGWHIPTAADWTQLTNYLGEDAAGIKMKSAEGGWKDNSNGSNSSGFNGLPGGYRDPIGVFDDNECCGFWWSSTKDNTGKIRPCSLRYNYDHLYRDHNEKEYGMSVRCLKD